MPNDRGFPMRILAIEPAGFKGHKKFNAYFLRCLRGIGKVTFVAPSDYLTSCDVDTRADIPESLLRHNSKFGARWSAIRVLDYILKNIRLDDYDAIVFLAYETISFSLRWPKGRKTFLFEHNNIEDALGSVVKTFFYKHISANCTHLTLLNHSAQYIQNAYRRSAVYIPHPYYRAGVSDSGIPIEPISPPNLSSHKIKIFSPSTSTPQSVQGELKKYVTTTNGKYHAIFKGNITAKGEDWETSPFFKNYENLMQSCDRVFLGACFEYRVSGVAYEALSYGKIIAHLDSPFARELMKDYPHLLFPIKAVSDISELSIDPEKMDEDHRQYLIDHSFLSICEKIRSILT